MSETDKKVGVEGETDTMGKKSSVTERVGDDTVSGIEASEEDVTEAASENGGLLPVDRDYDWDLEKLDTETVAEYVESGSEFSDMMREIRDAKETEKLPRFRFVGPTGCGKTTAGENVAVELDAPCFTIECHDGLRPNNLLGIPTYVGDETWWTDGPVTKALLSSKEQQTVLILDEVNRTTSRTLSVIMSVLDHRCNVTLNARGGEVVSGNPYNLVVFATMNEGDGYIVNNIDKAQLRRFGNTSPADYIGRNDVNREAHLVEYRTPIGNDVDSPKDTDFDSYEPSSVAREVVKAANSIRDQADRQKSDIGMGLPTSSVLDWCRTAWTYRDDECEGGPLIKAAERSFIKVFYEDTEDKVKTAIESHVRGMNIGDSETGGDTTAPSPADPAYKSEIEVSDESYLMCGSCGFYEKVKNAEDDVVISMECPDCSSPLDPKEST